MKATYGLDDNEVALLFGTAIKYDIAEMVDPQYNVVAKVPKIPLLGFQNRDREVGSLRGH